MKEQLEVVKEESEECRSGNSHLEWSPKIMGFFHLRNVFQKEVITFSKLWEGYTQDESLPIIREEKMGATKDQDFTIQRRYIKQWGIWRTQFLKNLLSILSVWIRNDVVMNEEDDEAERRSLPMKQIKISIQLSFHYIIFLCICLYSVIVLCMIGCLHYDKILLICMWWVSSSWGYTNSPFLLI